MGGSRHLGHRNAFLEARCLGVGRQLVATDSSRRAHQTQVATFTALQLLHNLS